MPEPAILAKGLQKSYPLTGGILGLFRPPMKRVPALRGVDLRVEAGEIFGLLGPNGAGKSTLMRILATLVVADGGSARVGGADVRVDQAIVRRRIGVMLEHERSFFGRLTGRQNLRFFADLQGIPPSSKPAWIDELLVKVGLEDAADRRVQTYSLGMQHRLGLARALLTDPDVLLLDEPTRSLDPEAKQRMSQLLRHELAGSSKSILLLTHDMDIAEDICDRVGFLVDGSLRREGRPADLVRGHGGTDLNAVYRATVSA